jgi:CRP-like cAMP-binding protein
MSMIRLFRSPAKTPPGPRPEPRVKGPRLGELDEATTHSVYSVAAVKRAVAGEIVLRESDETRSLFALTSGAVELTSTAGGPITSLGVVRAGEFLGTFGGTEPVRLAYTATAREPSALIEITPAAFNLLSLGVQLTVSRWAGASAWTCVSALLARQAELSRVNMHLMGYVQRAESRAVEWLASPPVDEALVRLPKLPLYATELATKLLDENANTDEVVEGIKNDPALAGLVLKTVNSAYYGLSAKISDYYRALLHLGTNRVYQLVLNAGIKTVMPDTPEAREVQAHSYLISLIAFELARLSGTVRPQLATTVGLLHDVGRSVGPLIAADRPDLAAGISLADPAKLGARLLASWELPEVVHEVIAHQNDPEFSPPDRVACAYPNEVGVLYLAHLCYDLLVGRSDAPAPSPYLREYLSALKLADTDHVELYRTHVRPALARQVKSLPAKIRASLSAEL